MTILFFDTETTGLVDFKKDLMDPSQPRIVQLAAVLTDDEGGQIDQMNAIIKPDGWTIPEEASAVHGITLERCQAEGIPMPEALERFNDLKGSAQARCAFNIDFDKRMLAREAHIYGLAHNSEGLQSHCVMRMAKKSCKLPPTDKMMAVGIKDFKTPTLQEAYRHFFGKDFEGAHDAMSDVIATMAIFFKMRELERVSA